MDIDFDRCLPVVEQARLTGRMLLYDADETFLRQIGIDSQHVREFWRQIEELRHNHQLLLQESTQEQNKKNVNYI